MIPKVIHYCWFGQSPLPENVQKCIQSWKKYCPDYEIIQWNETNYNIHKHPFMLEAYELKKYAFVSDYARLDIVYNYGGVYLDTDVELIKSLDKLLSIPCFMGYELSGRVNTGIGFGAEKNAEMIKKNMEEYKGVTFIENDKQNLTTCVDYTCRALDKLNYNYKNNNLNSFELVTIFPTEYFAPFGLKNQKLEITSNTYSIHHYDASWYEGNKYLKKIKKKILPLKIFLKEFVNNFLGEGTYEKIKNKLK